jgi:hypothetical protein
MDRLEEVVFTSLAEILDTVDNKDEKFSVALEDIKRAIDNISEQSALQYDTVQDFLNKVYNEIM